MKILVTGTVGFVMLNHECLMLNWVKLLMKISSNNKYIKNLLTSIVKSR